MLPDFDRVAAIYDTFRPSFTDLRFTVLAQHGLADGRGRTAVDLGTGTGAMAFTLASCGYRVTGVDVSRGMLERARTAARRRALRLDVRLAPSTDTGLADGCADVITASQSWHLFDERATLRECGRLLRPGGRLLLMTYDWVPAPGSAVALTEDIIKEIDPGWAYHGGTGRHDHLAPGVAAAGFTDITTWSHPFEHRYTVRDWIGRIRTSSSGGAGLAPALQRRLEQRLHTELTARFGDGPVPVAHTAWSLSARRHRPGPDRTRCLSGAADARPVGP